MSSEDANTRSHEMRRVFYVDIGSLTPEEALAYIDKVRSQYQGCTPHPSHVISVNKTMEVCAMVDCEGSRCEQLSSFWIGHRVMEWGHNRPEKTACGDHVSDLRGKDDIVIRLSDMKRMQ